jgi:DNA-directed RNA polymerase subunit RPC12/RpoP
MKIQIGQREKVLDPSTRQALMFASAFIPAKSIKPKKVTFDTECNDCGHKIEIVMSEDIETGKIWLEGPIYCDNCGGRIAAKEVPSDSSISQETIVSYFGQ